MASYSLVRYAVSSMAPLCLHLTLPLAPPDAPTGPTPAGPSEREHISFGEYFHD